MKKVQGFLLIEVAIALCVMGVLTAMIAPVVRTLTLSAQQTQTRRACETALCALAAHLESHGWLPYAAVEGEAPGLEVQGVCCGILPYKTLCLERASILDGHHRPLTYVVHPYLTGEIPFTPLHSAAQELAQTFKNIAGAERLRVFDPDGSPAMAAPHDKDFCAAVVMSLFPKDPQTRIVQTGDRIEVFLPTVPGPSFARWISRNNLAAKISFGTPGE